MKLVFSKLAERAEEQEPYLPLSTGEIVEAEAELGFALPEILKKIYQEIGDGGFGPGHGFLGLLEGSELLPDESVVELYVNFRGGDAEEPSFTWPEGLLPVVDWGCAIRSCVDCSEAGLPVIRFDPNEAGAAQFVPEGMGFEEWLQAWLDGRDLWNEGR